MTSLWVNALESSAFAENLRRSLWAYPLVNTGHILGIALLIGGALPLNLRLMGVWKSTPLGPLERVLSRTSDAGLLAAVVFGLLLFISRPSAYLSSGIFIAKMVVLLLGVSGTAAVRIMSRRQRAGQSAPPTDLRLVAGVSTGIWVAVLFLGRLIGYF
jgi:hypothetical protein